MNGAEYKQTLSFDAELIDADGVSVPVDCTVKLPTVWGDAAAIRFCVPHSAMPVGSVEKPYFLDVKPAGSGFRCIMEDIWCRKITKSLPPRNLGAAEISVTHISSLCVSRERKAPVHHVRVFISSPDFLDRFVRPTGGERSIDSLASFHSPELGRVKLQRYWVTARGRGARRFLLKVGHCLEIVPDVEGFTMEDLLARLSPILNVLSILFRQRILVHGWYIARSGTEESYWKNPLQPIRPPYVGVEPGQYLCSRDNLQNQVNCAIDGYYELGEGERTSVSALSFCLSPAIQMRGGERFMALFRQFESMGRRATEQRSLSENETHLLERLRGLAELYRGQTPELCSRLDGFVGSVSGGHAPPSGAIVRLLRHHGVSVADLWPITGDKGLTGIRNKLAHGGSHRIHHQGLAVATFHLSLLAERLVFALLRFSLEKSIENKMARDEWLQAAYFRRLQKDIFNVDAM